MSIYRDDWKFFDQYSDRMVIRDLTSKGKEDKLLLGGVRDGLWAAFAIYDEDFTRIERVVAGTYEMVKGMTDASMSKKRRREKDKVSVYSKTDTIKMSGGVLSIFDEYFSGKWPNTLDEDKLRLNEKLEELWGKPHDPSKSDRQQFFELACHMVQPDQFPAINSAKYGAFAKLDGKEAEIMILRDEETYDVIALEIKPKR